MPFNTARRPSPVIANRGNKDKDNRLRTKKVKDRDIKDKDATVDSSEEETDKMEGIQDESDLDKLAQSGDDNELRTSGGSTSNSRRNSRSRSRDVEDGENEQQNGSNKRIKLEQQQEEEEEEEEEEEDEDVEEEEELDDDERGEREEEDEEEDKEKDEEDKEKLQEEDNKRVEALEELKDIEVEFAKLKDLLYETQLNKLEFELKLCESSKHPDYIKFFKIVEDNFNKKMTKFTNYEKYKLKCIDNETRAKRVAIHQQFIKECQDLKSEEICQITGNWYEINKERRNMDNLTLNLPEYYQFNNEITSSNINQVQNMNELVNQRNLNYLELSYLKNIQLNQHSLPSSLNDLNSCSNDEILNDLIQMKRMA